MKVRFEASLDELEAKGESLVKALVHELEDIHPELSESLSKALPPKELELKYPYLRELHKRSTEAYRGHLKAMLADIRGVINEKPLKKSEGPYIGPRGGKWEDAEHTIPWKGDKGDSGEASVGQKVLDQLKEDAPGVIQKEIAAIANRAIKAGADAATVKYVGAGAEGVILTDKSGRAFKVGRSSRRKGGLANEAGALESLQGTSVAKYVPKFHSFDKENNVLVREMAEGRPGGWSQGKALREIYEKIVEELKAKEWSAPEFKEDSFILDGDAAKLVDIGFVHPRGKREVKIVRDDLDAAKEGKDIDLLDMGFSIRNLVSEGHLDPAEARKMGEKIQKLKGPESLEAKQFVDDLDYTIEMREKQLKKAEDDDDEDKPEPGDVNPETGEVVPEPPTPEEQEEAAEEAEDEDDEKSLEKACSCPADDLGAHVGCAVHGLEKARPTKYKRRWRNAKGEWEYEYDTPKPKKQLSLFDTPDPQKPKAKKATPKQVGGVTWKKIQNGLYGSEDGRWEVRQGPTGWALNDLVKDDSELFPSAKQAMEGLAFYQERDKKTGRKSLLNVVENDPGLTAQQKQMEKSDALLAIMDKPKSDPKEWQLPSGARVNDPWEPKEIPKDAKWKHPDFGEGTGAAPWQKGEDWAPDLHTYDKIVVNSSAGKDSQAMLTHVINLAKEQGYPMDKIVVVHADLGRAEWEGTKDLAKDQADHYGLRFEVVQRQQNDLIEQIEERHGDLTQRHTDIAKLAEAGVRTWADLARTGQARVLEVIGSDKGTSKWEGAHRAKELIKKAKKVLEKPSAKHGPDTPVDFGKAIAWPSSDARYCTSDHKRAEVKKLLTRLAAEHREANGPKSKPRILNALGIRAQESTSRENMDNFSREEDTGKRTVDRWYPIHRWHEEKVWSTIEESGVPYHKAYDLGMRRLSCVFCVFATREDLMVAATHNPNLFNTYLELEEKVGASFKSNESLADVREEIRKRREEGLELNEQAEWVKKSLDIDLDLDLIKAAIENDTPITPTLVGPVLEAALVRLTKSGDHIGAVTMEWKVEGACVHLESVHDSHHVEYLPYPGAYNASMIVGAFAQRHDLQLIEHNAPPYLDDEAEDLEKSGRPHKYKSRKRVKGRWVYEYERVSESKARKIAKDADKAGKHGKVQHETTYNQIKGEHVKVRVPIESLDAIDPGDKERVKQYAQTQGEAPPIRLGHSARSAKKGVDKLYVADGNHRVAAAKARGEDSIEAIIPVEDYERWVGKEDSAQLDLFEREAKASGVDLPSYFPSGSNHVGEILGFTALGMNVGVAAHELDTDGLAEEALVNLAGKGNLVFVDSGAFSEMYPNFPEKGQPPEKRKYPDKPMGLIVDPEKGEITDAEWKTRLDLYDRLATKLKEQLYAVGPDMVGNQEKTLERMQRYATQVKAIRAKGANMMMPVQKGQLSMAAMDREIEKIMGDTDYIRAIPMKKDATSVEDLEALLTERKPVGRIHLLGLGEKSDKYPEVMAMIKRVSPETKVTLDSVAITAGVGRPEDGPPRALTAAQDRVRASMATNIFRGPVGGLEYTDMIASPQDWAPKSIREWGAKKLGLTGKDLTAWKSESDKKGLNNWLQEDDRYLDPQVEHVLDMMWTRHALGNLETTSKGTRLAGGKGLAAERKKESILDLFAPEGPVPQRPYAQVTQEAREHLYRMLKEGDQDKIGRARSHLMDVAIEHALVVREDMDIGRMSEDDYERIHGKAFGPVEDFNPKDRKWKPKDPDLAKSVRRRKRHAIPQDHTKPMVEASEDKYQAVRKELADYGYDASDFDNEGGRLYGWSTNQLRELLKEKRG